MNKARYTAGQAPRAVQGDNKVVKIEIHSMVKAKILCEARSTDDEFHCARNKQ
jgi:hypothetical protein